MSGNLVHEHFQNRTNVERYQQRMDAAITPKWNVIEPYLEEIINRPDPVIVSIGAGSGALEAELVKRAQVKVIAFDVSLPMLSAIQNQSSQLETDWQSAPSLPDRQPHLWAINADATQLPLGQTADAILGFSVFHEVATFAFDGDFGKMHEFFKNLLTKLKPGGLLCIRDFVQPEHPHKLVKIKLGTSPEFPPLEYLEFFLKNFKGMSLLNLRIQVAFLKSLGQWHPGAQLLLTRAQAMELIAHYSWRSSPEEIRERYAFLPLEEYVSLILEAGKSIGIELKVEDATAEAQPGYDQHTQGQIDILKPDGERQQLPAWTGKIVIRRV